MTNDNTQKYPRLTDNDRGEITITLDGKELRGWSYDNEPEQYLKIRMAREFIEGWLEGYGAGLDRGEALVMKELQKP